MRVNLERVVIGTALLIAAPILLPIVKTTVSAAGNIGARTATTAWTRLRTTACIVKEEAEDILTEAQFEQVRKRADRGIREIEDTTVSATVNIGAKAATIAWNGLCATARIAKEEAEDIVVEAQFETLRKHVDREIYE